MADFFRHNRLLTYPILTLLSCLLLLLVHVNNVRASPFPFDPLAAPDFTETHLWKRVAPVAVTSDDGNVTSVINPSTQQEIAQGGGTDGAGTNFSVPALIWLAFVFATGVPLAVAGIRLWRVTTGMGVGLALTLAVWAAFVNTVGANGLSDLVLTVISMGAFGVGFVLGALNLGKVVGVFLIGLLGGFSVGVRVVLLRPGLLIPIYVLNWLVLVPFILIGLASVLLRQRLGITSCCAAIGTFLSGLGVDLILEKQSGISFALRFLFDRNNSHFLAIVHQGYNPTVMTQIILGASIGAIPIFAFAQHKIFKAPFWHKSSTETDFEIGSVVSAEPEPGMNMSEAKPVSAARSSRMQLMKSRFSLS